MVKEMKSLRYLGSFKIAIIPMRSKILQSTLVFKKIDTLMVPSINIRPDYT